MRKVSKAAIKRLAIKYFTEIACMKDQERKDGDNIAYMADKFADDVERTIGAQVDFTNKEDETNE